MYNTIAEIEKNFRSVGLTCESYEEGNFSFLKTVLTEKGCTAIARFISGGDEAETKMITNAFVTIPLQKRAAAYVLLNELNISYKFVKFVMDDNGGVYGEYDIPAYLNKNGLGVVALEITLRTSQIIREAYQKIVNDLAL